MERATLKTNAKGQLKGNWCAAIITFLVGQILLGIVPGIINFVESSGVRFVLLVISILIQAGIVYGIIKFSMSFVKGNGISFGDLFSGFNGAVYLKALGLYLLMTIAISIGYIILIVPGIIIALMYSQAFFILCDDNSKSVVQCLKESSAMMKGHKGELFVLSLSFIGWAILCGITCGIAGLWVTPYVYVTFANYYDSLQKSKIE